MISAKQRMVLTKGIIFVAKAVAYRGG